MTAIHGSGTRPVSRQVVDWLMSSRIDRELAMNALLMAVWRRKPADPVMVHSDKGSQFTNKDWRDSGPSIGWSQA